MVEYGQYLYVYAATLLLGFIMFIDRIIEDEHFTPIAAWIFSWFLLFLGACLFGSQYVYSIYGISVIIFFVLTYVGGGLLAALLAESASSSRTAIRRPIMRIPLWIDVVGIIAGIAASIQLRHGFAGSGYGGDYSLQAAAQNAGALYSGDYTLPTTANIGYAILVCASVFNGARIGLNQKVLLSVFCLLIILITGLLWTSVTTTRIYLGLLILMEFCGFISIRIWMRRPVNLLRIRLMTRSAIMLTPFLGIIIFVQNVRLNKGSIGGFTDAMVHMRPWFGGTISAFCVWLESASGDYHTWGSYLFRAVVKIFGVETQDKFEVLVIGAGDTSNATTMLRGAVQDFGVLGGGLFVFLIGFISIRLYVRALTGSFTASIMLSVAYATAFFSINNWLFLYGSRIYALVAMILLSVALVYGGLGVIAWRRVEIFSIFGKNASVASRKPRSIRRGSVVISDIDHEQ